MNDEEFEIDLVEPFQKNKFVCFAFVILLCCSLFEKFLHHAWTPTEIIFAFLFASFLFVIALFDACYLVILDFFLAIFFLLICVEKYCLGFDGWSEIFGAGIFSGILFALRKISRNGAGLGLGDVKFSFVLGFYFGFEKALLLLWLASILGGFMVLLYFLKHRTLTKTTPLPFGVCLSLAAYFIYFYAEKIFMIF